MDDFTNGIGGDNLRDASFSYLRSEQKISTGSTRSSFGVDRNKDQGEISVFGAERYFNMPMEDDPHLHHHRSSGGGSGGDGVKSINQPGTPSACSEMSWTSRSTAMLLRASTNSNSKNNSMERNPSRSRKRRVLINGKRSIFATLGCLGSCSDEKSVFVDHHHGGRQEGEGEVHHHQVVVRNINEANKLSQQPNRIVADQDGSRTGDENDQHGFGGYAARTSKKSEDHFAFPILSSTEENNKKSFISRTGDHRLQQRDHLDLQDPPRMSLEVFGSKTTSKAGPAVDEVEINLERRLSVLTWDAIPTKPQKKVLPKGGYGRPVHHDPDMDSDASSDLFEIENLTVGSCTTTRSLQLVTDVDNISRCATPKNNPGGGYEPSEASIEWSVVTASAMDFGSVVTNYGEKRISANDIRRYKASKSGGGILGCKSQKSVRVAESTYPSSTTSKEIIKASNV